MNYRLGRAAIIAAIALIPAAASAGELRLSIANGRVTLVAQDVTVKQILDEWSRVGQTTIIGAERLTSASISLELNDVAEGRALESLLRTASGYIAKPRTTTAGASGYDRILIMPTSRPPAMSPPPQPGAQPMTAPRPGQLPMPNPAVPGYPGGVQQGQPVRPPGVPGSNFNGFPQQPAPPVVPGGPGGPGGGSQF
jgi:hypothetical protein